MYNKKLCFNNDGKFIILQVSDAQDMHIPRKAMFKMLEKAYDKVNPDLIVLTGDNILGNHINDAFIGNRKVVKSKKGTLKRMTKALSFLINPIEKRRIPFAFIFGNHDDMNIVTKKEQAEIFGSYNYCVDYRNSELPELLGSYYIPVYSSDGNTLSFGLWMIDSAGSDDNGNPEFNYVKPEIISWYINKSSLIEKAELRLVNSIMFQHIPVPDVKSVFIECDSKDKNALFSESDGKYYKLNNDKALGFAFEYPAVTDRDFNQLDALKDRGDVVALVFGHDHLNSFTANIDGINIVQTSGASFRSYGNIVSRGVRVFELDQNDTSSFKTYTLSYFDLFGKRFLSVIRYILNADEYEKIKLIIVVLLITVILGLMIYIVSTVNLINRFML